MSNTEAGAPGTTLREIKTTCCYCGTGCGVIATTDGTQVTAVRGDPDHPANFGRLCTKGSTLHLTMQPALQQQAVEGKKKPKATGGGFRNFDSW